MRQRCKRCNIPKPAERQLNFWTRVLIINKLQPMIPVGQKPLSLDDFSDILNNKKKITLDGAALEKVAANFRFLTEFSADKLIYGINTGFGPMAQYKVGNGKMLELQYNLIRSH